jgi:NAD(P)-dependent dehydrogenase (short-subunit alcohol dehydrogenase family)
MEVSGAVVFVSGTSRGIGRALVPVLLEAGAAKVYAGARHVAQVADLVADGEGSVEAVPLDITRAEQVATAAGLAKDTAILINNAGVNFNTGLLAAPSTDNARTEVEVNYLGTLAMMRAFAPVLKRNGGGAIVNLISILARVNLPIMGSLCASKAALFSATQGVRAELARQGTLVIGVMPGAVDTDMTRGLSIPKMSPREVGQAIVAALRAGTEDVYPGEMAQSVRAQVDADAKATEKQFAGMVPG